MSGKITFVWAAICGILAFMTFPGFAAGNEALSSIQFDSANKSVIEGVITEISVAPTDPEGADYPDAFYTAKMVVNGITEGAATPKIIQLVVPAFFERKLNDFPALLKAEGNWKLAVIPFDDLPKEKQSTLQSDDLNLFGLDRYFVNRAQVIENFTTENLIAFKGAEVYKSPYDLKFNPPISEKAKAAKAEFIAREKEKVEKLLASFEGRQEEIRDQGWQDWQKKREELAKVSDSAYWGKVGNGYFGTYEWQRLLDPNVRIPHGTLKGLVELDKFMELHGVQLIIQIIPGFAEFPTRIFMEQYRDLPDWDSLVLTKTLLDKGIEAFYCSDYFVENFDRKEFIFTSPVNAHPSDGGQDLLTDLILPRLERYELEPNLDAKFFKIIFDKGAYGDKWAWPGNGANIGDHKVGEAIISEQIRYAGKPLAADKRSKILIAGNSFIGTPAPEENSYRSYLSMKTNYAFDQYIAYGTGVHTQMPLKFLDDCRSMLKGRVAVILPFAPMHLVRNIPYINIKKIDADRRLLNGKVLVAELEIPKSAPAAEPSKDKNWPETLKKTGCKELYIDSPCFAKIDISEYVEPGVSNIVVIGAVVPRNAAVELTVGKSTQMISAATSGAAVTNFIFELNEGDTVIELLSEEVGGYVGIKSIMLYN